MGTQSKELSHIHFGGKLVPIFNCFLFTLFGLFLIADVQAKDTTNILHSIELNDIRKSQEEVDEEMAKFGSLILPELHTLKLNLAKQNSRNDFVSYAYQLDGPIKNYGSTTDTVLYYMNLPNGDYSLTIHAQKEDQELGQYILRFTVKLPVHEQWWFSPLLTFCLIMIPLLIFYFISLDRSRQTLSLETVRNQIASDLHDDIGANLGAIKNFTEMIEGKLPESNSSSKLMEQTKTCLEETITKLQDTEWSINPLNDSVELLLEKIQDFSTFMFSPGSVDFTFVNHYNKEMPILLDMKQRHSLLVMLKEVSNNIAKYAEASKVSLHIKNTKNMLYFTVMDNGVGFDPDEHFDGNGLRNLKRRGRENFIDVQIQSQKNKGTTVQIIAHSL